MRETRNTTGHRIRLTTAAFAIGLLASFWSTDDAGAQGAQDAEYACRPDVFRLCNQYVPHSGPITQCLKRNVRNLSPECRVAFVGKGKRASRKVRHRRHRR
jgi:hypothetical protein